MNTARINKIEKLISEREKENNHWPFVICIKRAGTDKKRYMTCYKDKQASTRNLIFEDMQNDN
jgi:hypothetical protein